MLSAVIPSGAVISHCGAALLFSALSSVVALESTAAGAVAAAILRKVAAGLVASSIVNSSTWSGVKEKRSSFGMASASGFSGRLSR